jgi:hypothetical protein
MLNKLSKKAGARMVLHNPNITALPNEYGIDLQPNTASSISIQMVKINTIVIVSIFKVHFRDCKQGCVTSGWKFWGRSAAKGRKDSSFCFNGIWSRLRED